MYSLIVGIKILKAASPGCNNGNRKLRLWIGKSNERSQFHFHPVVPESMYPGYGWNKNINWLPIQSIYNSMRTFLPSYIFCQTDKPLYLTKAMPLLYQATSFRVMGDMARQINSEGMGWLPHYICYKIISLVKSNLCMEQPDSERSVLLVRR